MNKPGYFFFASLITAYILMYQPFYFVAAISPSLRIGLEFLILLILLLIWSSSSRPGYIPTSFMVLPLMVVWIFFAGPSLVSANVEGEHRFPGFITKILLLVLGTQALQRHHDLARFLGKIWCLLWTLICVQTILAAIGSYTGVIKFAPVDETSPYFSLYAKHYFHPIFGFSTYRSYFGFNFTKVSGYLHEPIHLGFFAGLNVFVASHFLLKLRAKKFEILNLTAGFFSGSVLFVLFFLALVVFKLISKKNFQKAKEKGIFLLIFLAAVALTSAILLFFLKGQQETSLYDRIIRFAIGIEALSHANVHSFLFGNLFYVEAINADRAVSSGFLAILVERGLFVLLILSCLLYKYSKRDYLLTTYLLCAGMFLDYFWSPAFVICLVLFSCLSSKVLIAHKTSGEAGENVVLKTTKLQEIYEP